MNLDQPQAAPEDQHPPDFKAFMASLAIQAVKPLYNLHAETLLTCARESEPYFNIYFSQDKKRREEISVISM